VLQEMRRLVKASPFLMRIAGPLSHFKSVYMAHRRVPTNFPAVSGRSHLDTHAFSAFDDYQEWLATNNETISDWLADDRMAVEGVGTEFTLAGFCSICDEEVDFLVTVGNRITPNWREQLVCPKCGMFNRIRAALHIGIQNFGLSPDKKIYTTEQLGIVFPWLRSQFRTVIGSEYLPRGSAQRYRRVGINHQDIEALTLPDESADFIITFDVLEHVPDYRAALSSFVRVLRPGGRLILTAPFTIDKYETTVRAVLHQDGSLEHILPIEIHGNPLDPVNGSLCFRHYGWDILTMLKEVGFTDAQVHVYHNRDLGYLGGIQSLVSAVK